MAVSMLGAASAPRAPAEDLGAFFESLLRPTALLEIGVFAACVIAAWALVRAVRGPEPRPGSIWFAGSDSPSVIGGVLFPVVMLLLALLARWLLQLPAIGVPPAVFKIVLPMLVSLVVIRLVARVLQQAFPDSKTMRIVERSVSWLAWAAVALWITGLLPLILSELDAISWKIGSTPVSLRNLLEGLIAALLVLTGALWLSAALEAKLLEGAVGGAQGNLSARKMAANGLRALLLFLGLILALSAAGIDLTALSVLGGAFGVGLGLGLQRLAANYVSGFVILAERSVRIGDIIKVDNFEGRVTDINTRYTVIRNANGRESIVPNEMLVTQRVENSSLADARVSVSTTVQVAYGTDLEALFPRLVAATAAVPRVLAEPAPAVALQAFAADGLELNIGFWIADPENGQGNVRSDVNLALLRALNAAGVEIPFPQRVVSTEPRRALPASQAPESPLDKAGTLKP
jgi:small-conductance mechanosensitive channel